MKSGVSNVGFNELSLLMGDPPVGVLKMTDFRRFNPMVPITGVMSVNSHLRDKYACPTANAPMSSIMTCYSVRNLTSDATKPIFRLRRANDNVEADFLTDGTQSYLQTSTGTSYASWISGTTGRVVTWYDQSGQNNHAVSVSTVSQPEISLQNGKYVLYYNKSVPYRLDITTAIQPKAVISHFSNNNTADATLLSTPYDLSIRFGYYTGGLPAGTSVLGDSNYADWYHSSGGTKLSYVNGVSSTTLSVTQWNHMCLSTTSPIFNNQGTNYNNSAFKHVGFSPYTNPSTERSLNGYISEVFCFNKAITSNDMVSYHSMRLF